MHTPNPPKTFNRSFFRKPFSPSAFYHRIQTQSAISAANSLLQSAELVLPKQKRALAVTEHKHAVVVSKRKSKTNQKEQRQGLTLLPDDSAETSIVEFILGTRQLSDDSSSDSDSDTDTEDEHVGPTALRGDFGSGDEIDADSRNRFKEGENDGDDLDDLDLL
ncbi:hypothetical protein OROHE_021924 [Orobanche hederae]